MFTGCLLVLSCGTSVKAQVLPGTIIRNQQPEIPDKPKVFFFINGTRRSQDQKEQHIH